MIPGRKVITPCSVLNKRIGKDLTLIVDTTKAVLVVVKLIVMGKTKYGTNGKRAKVKHNADI